MEVSSAHFRLMEFSFLKIVPVLDVLRYTCTTAAPCVQGNPFGLTANHEKIVSDFFAFARLKRTERLLGVDGTVDDVRDSRYVA